MAPADSTLDKSPAFQFYPRDYLSDAKTRAMSFKQRGMYWDLVSHCWLEGGLPDDPKEIARILGITTPARFEKNDWPVIGRCFRRVETGGHQHPRLDRERQKQGAFHDDLSERGKRGARKRWSRRSTDSQPIAGPADKDGQHLAGPSPGQWPNDASSSATAVVPPSPQGGNVGERPEDALASDFLERYPEVYAKCRSGASYVTTPANFQRDYDYARALARGWPDLGRLLAMLEIFLRRKDFDAKNIPGTPGQFLNMAPDCDRILREHGR